MKRILLLVGVAISVLAIGSPGWAVSDFEIGGDVQFGIGWTFTDIGEQDDPTKGFPAGTLGLEDSTDFFAELNESSRINFKAKVGNVTGFYELGLGPGAGIQTRHAWAEWDAGALRLLVGRTWGIVAYGYTDIQLGPGDAGYGNLDEDKVDQIRVTIPKEAFTFEGALYQARGRDLLGNAVGTEAPIPGLAASTTVKPTEMLTFTPSGYFQTFEFQAAPGGIDGEDVSTWVLALNGRVDLEALYFVYQAWYAENPGSGGFDAQPFTSAVVSASGTGIEDVPAYGGWARVVIPLETVEVGAGFTLEYADWDDAKRSAAAWTEDGNTRWATYVNVTYNFTENFYVIPEVSYYDNGDNRAGADQGSVTVVGAHFQADF